MSDIEDRIYALVAKETRRDRATLSPEMTIEDLGVTSLEMVEVLMQLEDDLKIEIPLDATEAARTLRTLGDLVARVRELAPAPGT
ncbi:MAG: acyl carrier protein [Rhodospirillales bacterium]|jgi:acyl carrier protein